MSREVSDRAHRYRARSAVDLRGQRCALCGRRRNLVVDHRDADERNDSRSNFRVLCKRCNTRLGLRDARRGRGRRTVQYNPGAATLAEYVRAAISHARGSHDEGGATIHATPRHLRQDYAEEIWKRRRKMRNPFFTDLEFKTLQRELMGGNVVVLAHEVGTPENQWKRVIQLRVSHSLYLAKLLSGAARQWIVIDGLHRVNQPLPRGRAKLRQVMTEFEQGKLRSSSGRRVTKLSQARAIGLSEQRRAEGMNPRGVLIYDQVLEIVARKESAKATGNDPKLKGTYRHEFKNGGEIRGLPDGSLLICPRHKNRKLFISQMP